MSAATGSTVSDEVAIVVGNKSIAGWQSVSITRSAEMFPNHFSLSMTDPLTDPSQMVVPPGRGGTSNWRAR